MPFLFEFHLNKEKLSGVEIGFSHSRKWEEALDEAKLAIPFYTSEKPLSQYGLMEITIVEIDNYTDLTELDRETIEMLVVSDKVKTVSQYGTYRHDINLIEYTAKLDAYIMASLAKTRDMETDLLAKFEVTEKGSDLIQYYKATGLSAPIWIPPIKIKQKYYANIQYTFSQVEQAYQAREVVLTENVYTKYFTYTRRPTIFRYHNVEDNTTSAWFDLSAADVTIEFTKKGKYYIEYGIDALDIVYSEMETEPAGKHSVFRFYFSVSEYFQQTVYDVLDSVRSNVSKGGGIESEYFFADTRIFDIDPTLETELKSIQIPQMYLEQATARQMLIFALSYINALPRLEYKVGLDNLTIERFNLPTGSFTKEDVFEQSGSQNINQIGTRSYEPLNQVLPNNMDEPTTYAPSQDGYQQVRADDLQIRDDSFAIRLEKEIYTPKEFVVKVPSIKLYVFFSDTPSFNYTGDTSITLSDLDVSLAERLINIDEWKLKYVTDNFPTTTSFIFFAKDIGLRNNMVENLYWQLGAKKIHLSDVYGKIVNKTLFQNVIKLSIYEYLMINLPKPFIITYRPGEPEEQELMVIGTTDIEIDLDFLDDVSAYKDLRFRFSYLTLENLITKQEKEDLTQIDFYSEMRQNQDETVINAVRSSRKNYGNLQRTGNKAFSFPKVHYSLKDQYKIGEIDINNFTITNINRQFYGKYFLAEYFVTKYHNRESRQTIVDQTYRWRDNYTKNVFNRHENYSDYLVIYPPFANVKYKHTKIYSRNNTIYPFLKILLGETISDFQTRATVALIRTDGMLDYLPEETDNDSYNILTQVSSYPTTKGLAFTFGFDSNQVAGQGLVQREENYYNQAVRYTDENGRFSKLSFIIKPKFEIDDGNYEIFPRVKKEFKSQVYNGAYFWCGNYTLNNVGNDALIIDKDPLTNLKITYQLNAVSYQTGLYVLGQLLFNENFLVNNPNEQMKVYLYLYNDDTYYGMFDDLDIKSGYFDSIQLSAATISYEPINDLVTFIGVIDLTGVTSWAIGNADGKLYIACNSNYNGFKIKESHFRPGVKEIGFKDITTDTTGINISEQINFGLENLQAVVERVIQLSKTLELEMQITTLRIIPILEDLTKELALSMSVSTQHIEPILENLIKTLELNMSVSTQHITPILADITKELALNMNINTSHITPILADIIKVLDLDMKANTSLIQPKLADLTKILMFNMKVNTSLIQPKLQNLTKTLEFNMQTSTIVFEPKIINLNKALEFNMTLDDFSIYEKVWTATSETVYNATIASKKHEEASSNYPNPENEAYNYVEDYVVKVTDPTLTDPTIYYWLVVINFK